MGKKLDLKGQKFGRLTVLRDSDKKAGRHIIWVCICACGQFKEVRNGNLKSGNTRSCGCWKNELLTKHDESRNRLYIIWCNMKARCYYPKQTSYKYYGNKGIKVCEEWKNNYPVFKFWAILNGYQDNLTIDRIDSNNGYNPNNCQWITGSENARKGAKERWRKNK